MVDDLIDWKFHAVLNNNYNNNNNNNNKRCDYLISKSAKIIRWLVVNGNCFILCFVLLFIRIKNGCPRSPVNRPSFWGFRLSSTLRIPGFLSCNFCQDYGEYHRPLTNSSMGSDGSTLRTVSPGFICTCSFYSGSDEPNQV